MGGLTRSIQWLTERNRPTGRVIMPRLVFEEPKGGPARTESARHRRDSGRDNVVVVLKAATFALVIALLGAAILLATAGGEEPRADAPPVPEIKTSHVPTTTTTTPPLAEVLVPEVRTQTTELSVAAPPPTTTTTKQRPGNRPPTRDDRFVEIGHPCDTPGAYAFTERYEPVVCVQRRGGKAVWRSLLG
jgi:hypothetical protein